MDTTLIVNGFSVLDNPQVNTNSSHGGEIMIHGGTSIFQPDDIIVVHVTNATAAGELNGQSRIVGVTVYDNVSDYLAGTVKYDYHPMNPGQYANIQADVSGLGDTYVRFNANVLVSSNPAAPHFTQLILTPGIDLTHVHGTPVEIQRYTSVDYNHDGNFNPGTTEVGNGLFSTENNLLASICLAAGTLVLTAQGEVPVERLEPGDRVLTRDRGAQPLRWTGGRRVSARGELAPVRIRAGVLGNRRDLWVSPNHRMLICGARAELLFGEAEVLVAAKHLVDGVAIRFEPRAWIDYHHILFDSHQIVWAEGAATESLFPGEEALKAAAPEAVAEILMLFPELARPQPGRQLSRYALTSREAQVLRLTA